MVSRSLFQALLVVGIVVYTYLTTVAQRVVPIPPPQDLPRPMPPEPSSQPQIPAPLPPPDQLLPQPITPPSTPEPPGNIPDTIQVKRFEILGSTVFSAKDFEEITKPYINRNVSFAELLQLRSAIAELYIKKGYVTSAAVLPPQVLSGGQG